MKISNLKSLFIYLLFAITGIGSSNSFAFSPVASYQVEKEFLQQDYNLPFISEEIEGTFFLQVISGKHLGNQGKIIAFTSQSILGPQVENKEELSVYLQLHKILLSQHIFPFQFFW